MTAVRAALALGLLIALLSVQPSWQLTRSELVQLQEDLSFLDEELNLTPGRSSFISVQETKRRKRDNIDVAKQEAWGPELDALVQANKATEWAALKEQYAAAVSERQDAQDAAEDAPAAKAKVTEAEQKEAAALSKLVKAGTDRARIVNALVAKAAAKVFGADPNMNKKITAASVGSKNPTSDYDITVSGEKADALTAEFNAEFEKMFGKASGDVFDTNIYGFGWGVSLKLFGGKIPVCHTNPWRDDLNEYFANPAPACMPSEVEREAALDDLTMTVGPALAEADRDKQHEMSLAKIIFYMNTIHRNTKCKDTNAVGSGAVSRICEPPVAFSARIARFMKSEESANPNQEGHKQKRRTSIQSSIDIFSQAFVRASTHLEALLVRYCGGDKAYPNLGALCKPGEGPDGKPRPEIDLDKMQARNRAYEDMLRRIHAVLRGEVKNVACDAIKLMIYEALFYAPETYWTQSSFMFIVLALQSTTTDNVAANPAGARWLQYKFSPAAYFDIFAENLADLIKESSHGFSHDWDYEEYAVAASKYLTRLLLAAQPLVSWPAPETKGTEGNVYFKLQSQISGLVTCLRKPVAALAAEVRGKKVTSELLMKKEALLQSVMACYEDVMEKGIDATAAAKEMTMVDWYQRLVIELGSNIIGHYYNNLQEPQFTGKENVDRFFAIGSLQISERPPPKDSCPLKSAPMPRAKSVPSLPPVPEMDEADGSSTTASATQSSKWSRSKRRRMHAKAAKARRAKRAANKNRRKADTVLTAMAEDR